MTDSSKEARIVENHKELKEFLDGKNTYGLENPDSVKGLHPAAYPKKGGEAECEVRYSVSSSPFESGFNSPSISVSDAQSRNHFPGL